MLNWQPAAHGNDAHALARAPEDQDSRRIMEVAKVRRTAGATAARRATATAVRCRNMAAVNWSRDVPSWCGCCDGRFRVDLSNRREWSDLLGSLIEVRDGAEPLRNPVSQVTRRGRHDMPHLNALPDQNVIARGSGEDVSLPANQVLS